MSIIWLVAPDDKPTAELTDSLAGSFAVRRIAGLATLVRLLKMNEVRPSEGFVCLISIKADQDLIAMHSAISCCLKIMSSTEICLFGELTDEQMKLAKNFGLLVLAHPTSYTAFGRDLQQILQKNTRRIAASISENIIRIGDIEVDRDLASMRVLATGFEESLTPKEVRIIQILSVAANKTVGRDELIGKVWAGVRVSTSTIDSHMSRLRKKIEQSFECRLETEYGSGWKLAVRDP